MTDYLLTLGGLVALVIGAELMIRGSVDLALRARISPLVVGLTIVSIGTSAPELLVSLFAAAKGSSSIAIGNVVGSNIINISFILGLSILVFPLEVDREAKRIHWPVVMIVSVLFWWLVQDDAFARWEGAVFIALLVGYVGWMIVSSRRGSKERARVPATMPIWKALVLLVVGVTGLAKGAEWFVDGASAIASTMGVSEQLIGVTVVAVGTSLPELVTSMIAAFRKQPDISLGNLLGSNVFNILGILGVTAVLKPIPVDHVAFRSDLQIMLASVLLLYPLMRFTDKLGRWQGAVLVVFYAGYIALVLHRG